MELQWKWFAFDELSTQTLYDILRLRQEVFVVEQKCAYLDCDNRDNRSWHLTGYHQDQLLAYCRVVPPSAAHCFPNIGRLLTHQKAREKGLGRELIQKALAHIKTTYPGADIRISAQLYLIKFYQSVGFHTSSETYDEDGIPHIEMMYQRKQVLI